MTAPVIDPPTPLAAPPVDPPAPPPPVDPPAPPADPPAPPASDDGYTLTPPTDSTLTADDLDRIATHARAQGLSQTQAQQLAEFYATESSAAVTAAIEALAPGGAEWKKTVERWTAETLADPKLGATPDARKLAIQRGHRVVEQYAELHPDDGPAFKAFLDESGVGFHPAAARFFAWLGSAASEGKLVTGSAHAPPAPKPTSVLMYGEDGGRPKPAA